MTTAPPRKNRAWVWFFVFVVTASVGVAGFMIWFNLRQQLKPEQLEAAWERWKQHAPRDYVLSYRKELNQAESVDHFVVTVRGGKVEAVLMNDAVRLGPEQLAYHSMDRVFRDIERFLEMDAKAGRKTFTTAIFDAETGAVRRFIRRVPGTKERLQLDLKVEPSLPAPPD